MGEAGAVGLGMASGVGAGCRGGCQVDYGQIWL